MFFSVVGIISNNIDFLFFFSLVLGLELRVYTWSHSTSPFFCDFFFFEIEFCELFAWAGFEL
jgi:hypothetical protein